jgi:serine protease Do
MPTFFHGPPSELLYGSWQEVAVKKTIVVGVLLLVASVVMVAALVIRVDAQGRVFPSPNAFLPEGAGSSIGITVRDLNSEELEKAKLNQAGGALVTTVVEGGAGARAGLRSGDIVTEFDGERVRSARHLTRLVRETAPGRAVKSSVVRDGSRRTVEITPETRNAFAQLPQFGPELERQLRDLPRNFSFNLDPDSLRGSLRRNGRGRLGAALVPLEDQLASYFGVKQGALVSSVEADSSAARAGLKAGDVITSINGRSVDTVSDVIQQVREAQPGSTLEMTVMRDRKQLTLKATVPEQSRPRPLENRRSREL